MPVRALVAAGAVFGISAESIRVALVRLRSRGTIAHNGRGQYSLAASAQAVQAHVAAWARTEEQLVPWRGSWIGVHTGGLARDDRTATRRRERALQFLGFRRLAPHLFIRPDNLKGGVDAARGELLALGLDPAALVYAVAQLDPATEERARALWDSQALRRAYRDACAVLARSADSLARMAVADAMVESFVLGGKMIRQLALDPLLPEPLVPAAERAALVEAMRDYDRRGRDCWRPFMKSQGAPHLRTPRTAVAAHWPQRAGMETVA